MNAQVWSAVAMVVLAGVGHGLAVRRRRAFVRWAEGVGGPAVPSIQAVLDVIVGLAYVAFGAVLVPAHGGGVSAAQVLDAVAAFALVMTAVESASLMVLHRVAQVFEPWPRGAEARA